MQQTEEISLIEFWPATLRYGLAIFIAGVIASAIYFFFAPSPPSYYEASQTLVAVDVENATRYRSLLITQTDPAKVSINHVGNGVLKITGIAVTPELAAQRSTQGVTALLYFAETLRTAELETIAKESRDYGMVGQLPQFGLLGVLGTGEPIAALIAPLSQRPRNTAIIVFLGGVLAVMAVIGVTTVKRSLEAKRGSE